MVLKELMIYVLNYLKGRHWWQTPHQMYFVKWKHLAAKIIITRLLYGVQHASLVYFLIEWITTYLNMHMQYNTYDIHTIQGSYPIQAIRRSTYAEISHDKTPSQTSQRSWSLHIMSNKTQPERSNVVGLWPLYNLPIMNYHKQHFVFKCLACYIRKCKFPYDAYFPTQTTLPMHK